MRHCALRVQMRGGAEGADRFLVIEAEEQPHPLIKIALGLLRLRGDGVMQIAQPFQERAGKFLGGERG